MPETEDFDEAMRLGLKPRVLDPNRIAALPAMAPPTMPTGSGLNPATLDMGNGPINPRIAPMSPGGLPDPNDPKYAPKPLGVTGRLKQIGIGILSGLGDAEKYGELPTTRAQHSYDVDRQHAMDINSQADVDAQRQEREAVANRQPQPRDPLHVAPGEMVQNPDGSFTQVGTPKGPAENNPVHVAPGDYVQQDDGSFKQIGTPKGPEAPRVLMTVPIDPKDPSKGSRVIEARPGTALPAGAKTPTQIGNEDKPNAAEQMRADMGENVNENLKNLEEIVSRRGDLFGKLAGRVTKGREWLGTNDQDIATMKQIEDNLGRAMTGAHGMRNGQLVEKAANDILNSYKNGPGAVLAAIKSARDSIKTFTADVESKGGSTGATQKSSGSDWNPKTGRYE